MSLFIENLSDDQIIATLAWIKALRSGKYQQGHCRLLSQKGGAAFCCLGVACDLSNQGTWKDIDGLSYYSISEWEDYTATLPKNVKQSLGLNSCEGSGFNINNPINSGSADSLICLNDFFKWNFEQISNLIEEELRLAVPSERLSIFL